MNLFSFAIALGWPEHETLERLRELGLAETCARCGGTGHVSLDRTPETRCFRCAGTGDQLPKLTRTLCVEAAHRIVRGDLHPYLRRKQRRAEAARELPLLVAQCRRVAVAVEDRYELESVLEQIRKTELDAETGTALLHAFHMRLTRQRSA